MRALIFCSSEDLGAQDSSLRAHEFLGVSFEG